MKTEVDRNTRSRLEQERLKVRWWMMWAALFAAVIEGGIAVMAAFFR